MIITVRFSMLHHPIHGSLDGTYQSLDILGNIYIFSKASKKFSLKKQTKRRSKKKILKYSIKKVMLLV
jgi:hypothetical protein